MKINISDILERFRQNCFDAKNEEDVRIYTNILLDNLSNYYGLNKKTINEVSSVQGGRADSIYSDIIFEFKTPGKFNSQKGIDEAIYGRNKKDRGLFTYLVNFSLEELGKGDASYFDYILLSKVGIAFDGNVFVFFRYKENLTETDLFIKRKTKTFPSGISSKRHLSYEIEVVKDFDLGVKKLLLFLRSTKRKRLSSENLLDSFSSSSKITKESITYLYNLLNDNIKTNTRIKTLFEEWNRIFGDIYGEEETDFTKYTDALIKMYSFPKNIEIRSTLFVLQTYYSIVIKLLIHNLLESLTNPAQSVKKSIHSNELTSLFSGGRDTNYNIKNFFETHFFEWFILAKDLEMDFINDIITELDTFETTASVIKPEVVGDVLKKVYADLIPRGLRHLLGEYYTPDWLVDFTIEKSRYDIGLDTTILDPTCGSGAFLTHIIKQYIEKHKPTLNQNDLILNVTKNIVGFDINPIAVISAKANYILALGDITRLENEINIPVYMCDSILVPTVHAKQKEQKHAIEINTIVGSFEIPVFESREDNDYFLKTASSCLLKSYTFEEFYELIEQERKLHLTTEQIEQAHIFYDKLYSLHLNKQDGFWPIILKNSFAPLFSQSKFDVIVGNPPWITWKAMSDTYRRATLDIWLSYGIFEKSAYDKITSHDDFAMAVTYVSIDHYLRDNGIVSFVLPQTFVKSLKGGEGFRKFKITRDDLAVPFSIIEVYDMLGIKPFAGEASNRTSVYVFEKNKEMQYPMDNYYECVNQPNQKIAFDDSFEVAKQKMNLIRLSAQPVNDNLRSPWLTVKKDLLKNLSKFLGQSQYTGRKGIEPCGAKGIYLVNITRNVGNNIKIENLIERSRLEKAKELGVYPGVVEKDLVYPMVGGRNIDKWGINSYLYMVPHSSTDQAKYRGIDEKVLKVKYRKTYEWLFYFKDLLLETRIRSAKFFDKDQFPFYRLDNVGDYTFQPYKVLWREQSREMTAAVVSTVNDKYLGEKVVVCDSKVLYVSFEDELEAHYLCGILNSRIIGDIIEAYTIDTQRGVDIVNNIKIPKFDSNHDLHKEMANLSMQAHLAYTQKDNTKLNAIEKDIETSTLKIFNI
ncbi:N-6 DNA Methylase [Porphyromonadaceae bacterium KH3CP3RA]|nr:N-6 DNA Methylase [Porphyromonadaceae bacterium KH3CP3RA]